MSKQFREGLKSTICKRLIPSTTCDKNIASNASIRVKIGDIQDSITFIEIKCKCNDLDDNEAIEFPGSKHLAECLSGSNTSSV